jgi:hypothetical protein
MKWRALVPAALLACALLAGAAAAAKPPRPPKPSDPMLRARAVCDSLAGAARGREGVQVRTREDRMPFCNADGLLRGWTLVVEVADDAPERGLAAARDLEAWLRARGWVFQEPCFDVGPPVRRAVFTRADLGCSFDTAPLPREAAPAEGRPAPGYLLTLGVVVLDNPPR